MLYVKKNYFDSYCYSPPQQLISFIIKRNGYCVYSEYKTQGPTSKKNSHCTGYCLDIIYFTKVMGIDFISAVLNLNYQLIE